MNMLINFMSAFIFSLSFDFLHCEECEHRMAFHNPALVSKKHTAYEITLTQRNRCLQYPRCLLFGCCYDELLTHSLEYLVNEDCLKYPVYRCMFHDPPNCKYNEKIQSRLETLDLFSSTLTNELVHEGLVNLPPTPEEVYSKADARCEFKILFLVEGEDKFKLSSAYKGLEDLIFLSYKSREKGDFYFPTENVNYRMMALYLIARHLELSQTWIYNYFIFIDSDVTIKLLGMKYFTINLSVWRPAVASPSNIIYPSYDIHTEVFIDFPIKAYHRETVEMLFPLILDINEYELCPETPTLAQSLEAALLYRNHMLALNGLFIKGFKSASYKDECLTYNQSVNYYAYLPNVLSHCAIYNLSDGFNKLNGIYKQKVVNNIGGLPKIKLMNYHLLNQHYRYAHQNQSLCNSKDNTFRPNDTMCCCIDNTYIHHSNGIHLSTYHDKIIKYSKNNKYYYVWGKYKHFVSSVDLIYQMGFKDKDVITLNRKEFDSIAEPIETNQKCQNIILPEYAYEIDHSIV